MSRAAFERGLITKGEGAPTVSAPKGSLYTRTDAVGVYVNTDGGTTWEQVGAVAGALAINAQSGAAGSGLLVNNQNVSTLGTIDWAAYDQGFQHPDIITASTPTAMHYKITDGRIMRGTRAICSGGTAFTFGQTGGNPTRSTTAADDAAQSALAANANYALINPTGGTGWGVEIALPVYQGEAATLALYHRYCDVNVEWSSWFNYDTADVQTTSLNATGGGAFHEGIVSVAFTASKAGILYLRGRVASIPAAPASRRIQLGYATLS